ncbi:OmpA family protein [Croceicoccus gelatinilyticus]|uniref:OmpA family protein n=1 Tax=Croceicoccus gelatinilyticus TaxID=2835536 RepID=UPI001BCCE60E|nr:OmpA family protein [Croceicoccus gelatinilyticus]MBS7670981.1 OmpA family protein [Croceicoccus gelatinilyticus]
MKTTANLMKDAGKLALVVAVPALFLAGCNRAEEPEPEPEPTETPSPEASESPISILRETPNPIVEDLLPTEPFEQTVPFAEGGFDLSEEAQEAIQTVLESEQYKLGGAILIWGHTDSSGHDEANLRASKRRAEAVAEVLEEAGTDPDRIKIIPMGEMLAIAPNAKLDGTPDEEGRAKNRRVEISVAAPAADDADDDDAATEVKSEAAVEPASS